jgi:hypothetical protein
MSKVSCPVLLITGIVLLIAFLISFLLGMWKHVQVEESLSFLEDAYKAPFNDGA